MTGPDWVGDADLIDSSGPVSVTGATVNTFTNGQTDEEDEIDYTDDVDPSIVPWQVFVGERADNNAGGATLDYNFDVVEGNTYRIELFYTENWNGIFNFIAEGTTAREFDVAVDGTEPAEFADLNPVYEAAAFHGITTPNVNSSAEDKAKILGTVFTRSLEYTAVDGELNLSFLHDTQNPKINAIQITQIGGTLAADETPPVIVSVSVENLPDTDSDRTVTVVLTDNTGFDAALLAATSADDLVFSGIQPGPVTGPTVELSNGGSMATLTYSASAPSAGWANGVGTVTIAAGAFADAAGNDADGISADFVVEPNLSGLARGEVVRAINVGTTDQSPGNLGADPIDGPDDNRYGGAIAADTILKDVGGTPIAFEADDASYYTSPKTTGQLNNNVDGAFPTSNSGGIDLDGSALHTYRDSNADQWTATYDGFATGTYVVELHFAELFHSEANKRVGSFAVNGVELKTNYDAFVAAGNKADTPTVLRQNVIVTDGKITVDVDASGVGQAGYSAIVVYDTIDSGLPPTISVADVTVAEGEDATITVLRQGDTTEEVTVTLSLTDVTTDVNDRGDLAETTVTILAGQSIATTTVAIVQDEDEEPAETFEVSIDAVASESGEGGRRRGWRRGHGDHRGQRRHGRRARGRRDLRVRLRGRRGRSPCAARHRARRQCRSAGGGRRVHLRRQAAHPDGRRRHQPGRRLVQERPHARGRPLAGGAG